MKIESTTEKIFLVIPKVTEENLNNPKAWSLALKAEDDANEGGNAPMLRRWCFLGSVVARGIAKNSELAKAIGRDTAKGQITKGRDIVLMFLPEVLSSHGIMKDEARGEHYAEALEMAIATGESMDALSKKAKPKEPKEDTLENQVASLFAWAEKNGISGSDVLAEVVRQNGGI
jgi:hypothetical protein